MSGGIPGWLIEEVRLARRGQGGDNIAQTGDLLSRFGLPTVCERARCPNRGECFSRHTATFLILGDVCTRGCAFCAVKHGSPNALPAPDEPWRLASAVIDLQLSHVVVTSVTRDDLPDGGAGHFACVIRELRGCCPGVRVEVLVPDFLGSEDSLLTVLDACPDILAHNIETVPRMYPTVRRGASYARSLTLLRMAKAMDSRPATKSGFMLGMGETAREVEGLLRDLVETGCEMVTIGQYLSPSLAHTRVERYVGRNEFEDWRQKALCLGFKSVASGPLVRSSYKAPHFFGEIS